MHYIDEWEQDLLLKRGLAIPEKDCGMSIGKTCEESGEDHAER